MIEYSPEIGDRICAEMVSGKSLNTVVQMEGMPSKRAVMYWLRQHPEFEKIYRIAQQERAEGYIEEIIEISDDGSNDWMSNNDPDNPGYKLNGENCQRSRLRVDSRKWIVSKMMPRLYGDKVEHTGPEGGPLQVNIVRFGDAAK